MKRQSIRFLTCTVSGGCFEKGKTYPFCFLCGYAYMIVVDSVHLRPELINLDSYENGTYKIVGTLDDWEDAEFTEVVI